MSAGDEQFRAASAAAGLHFEDVAEGDELPPLVVEPDTRQLVMYAGAAGDFVPIHYDKDVAQRAGHDRVIIHGALKSAWMAQQVTAWAGESGWIREFSVQYRGIDYPGERKTCRGRVKAKREDAGAGLVELELSLEDASGAVTTTGSAVVELPRRVTA
jgi:acyl dehydratase